MRSPIRIAMCLVQPSCCIFEMAILFQLSSVIVIIRVHHYQSSLYRFFGPNSTLASSITCLIFCQIPLCCEYVLNYPARPVCLSGCLLIIFLISILIVLNRQNISLEHLNLLQEMGVHVCGYGTRRRRPLSEDLPCRSWGFKISSQPRLLFKSPKNSWSLLSERALDFSPGK